MELEKIVRCLKGYDGRRIKIMEVCGTHTAAIFKNGLRSLISPAIELVSGPGCPVCVTPAAFIDKCVEYAMRPGHVALSFGDMLKVPGTRLSLARARGEGGNVKMVYSPMEAVALAEADPSTMHVLAAVGFETTLPAHALVLEAAFDKGLENLKLITALRSVAPALSWIAETEEGIDGFICPGHVAVITGVEPFARLAGKYGKPFVIAGFDGEHLLAAIYATVRMVAGARAGAGALSPRPAADMALNLYPAAVRAEGNAKARELAARFFELGGAYWRGLGSLDDSGFYIKEAYAAFDGGGRGLDGDSALPAGCRCGDVLMGRATPAECPAFGASCRPDSPVGPCMVSAEGACGIWHQRGESARGLLPVQE